MAPLKKRAAALEAYFQPDFDKLLAPVPSSVYAPDDDSFLLARVVEQYSSGKVLEVGCGSGIQCVVAALKGGVDEVVGVDINPEAVATSISSAQKSGVASKCTFFQSDLFSSPKLSRRKFDTIIFNPPYLPTAPEEKLKGPINHAFDGGLTGRQVIDQFLGEFPKHLSEGGQLLMVASSLSGTDETIGKLKELGFAVSIEAEEKFFFEKLCVIRCAIKQSA